jgi:hypothetical protein
MSTQHSVGLCSSFLRKSENIQMILRTWTLKQMKKKAKKAMTLILSK